MLNKPKILIGTDFSDHSDLALKAGESIRRKAGGELHVIHVATYPPDWAWVTNSVEATYLPESFKQEIIRYLNSQLDEQVKRVEIECTKEIYFGRPFKALHEVMEQKSIDLLILGHRGAGALYELLGSLTSKIIASSKIPVLIINSPFEVKKIAGLIDAADPMLSVFPSAEELSFLFSAELEFISLWPDISAQTARRSPVLPTSHFIYTAEERSKIIGSMEDTIKSHMDPHSKAKILAEIISEDNLPEAIVAKLVSEGVDLTVTTRHKKKLIERLFIGSVSRRLLELYKGNMLVLPPEKK